MAWDSIGDPDKDKQTFLEDISVFETSPTKYPANGWLSVYQKSDEETLMLFKNAEEWLAKSGASAAAKTAMGEAMKCLKKAQSEFTDDQWKSFKKAFAFEGKETPEEEEKEKEEKSALKKSADDATAEVARLTEIVQKSVAVLDAPEPKVKDALDFLAPVTGHKPVHQFLAELPASVRARIEMLEKSDSEKTCRLEEMQKAQIQAERAGRVKVLVEKAAKSFANVPGASADAMGEILQTLTEVSPHHAETLEKILESVNGVMSKSAVIGRERGTSAAPPAASTAEAEIDRLADMLVAKSAEGGVKVTRSAAWNQVITLNPELGRRYDAEKLTRAGTVGLSQ